MRQPSANDVVAFVRDFASVPRSRHIALNTRLEADVGVTGDDGDELLRAAEREFRAPLTSREHGIAQMLGLGEHEFLFRPEGFDPLWLFGLTRRLRRLPRPTYRDVTVGELHSATLQGVGRDHPGGSLNERHAQ